MSANSSRPDRRASGFCVVSPAISIRRALRSARDLATCPALLIIEFKLHAIARPW
jgi:hypothetical protein